MSHTVQLDINGQPFSLETGRVAKQADGAVMVRHGGTMVLATCVAAKTAREGQDFFPLTVEYRERAYAGGRIPGGYFKREGAPVKKEILTSRLIDRPVRPLFPGGFKNEVQVICLVVSGDQENDPDVLAMNGASAALCLSGMPFDGPSAPCAWARSRAASSRIRPPSSRRSPRWSSSLRARKRPS
jgi:polyribonucleotide nucleotidyltransferase